MTETPIATARIAADVIAIAPGADGPSVLLIRRDWAPFEGCWALPGGHVDEGEESPRAAVRELQEETDVKVDEKDLTYVGTWARPGRDPRGRYVSDAYLVRLPEPVLATAGDDAREALWWPLNDLPQLAFDHRSILTAAVAR